MERTTCGGFKEDKLLIIWVRKNFASLFFPPLLHIFVICSSVWISNLDASWYLKNWLILQCFYSFQPSAVLMTGLLLNLCRGLLVSLLFQFSQKAKQRQRLYRFGDVEAEHVGLLCDVERVTPQVSGSASKARSWRYLPHGSLKLIKWYKIYGQKSVLYVTVLYNFILAICCPI